MKKSELRKIIQEEIKKLNESASHSVDIADGEPETGFLPGGHQRKLGINKGKPEPWFVRMGYKQLDFPKASYIYGKRTDKGEDTFQVTKKAMTLKKKDVTPYDKEHKDKEKVIKKRENKRD